MMNNNYCSITLYYLLYYGIMVSHKLYEIYKQLRSIILYETRYNQHYCIIVLYKDLPRLDMWKTGGKARGKEETRRSSDTRAKY